MKFDNVSELKEFLVWCRSQKMQQVTVGEMTFVFSGLALIDEEATNNEGTHVDASPEPVTDEELLFWSGGPAPKKG